MAKHPRHEVRVTRCDEARWFVRGFAPALDWTWRRRRTDRYHLASLSDDVALKQRGGRDRYEMKIRVGPPVDIDVRGVPGRREQWVKLRVDEPAEPYGEAWVEVDKVIWRRGAVELAQVSLDGHPWWTVAVPLRDGHVPGHAAKLVERLLAGRPDVVVGGFPVWIAAVRARRRLDDAAELLADERSA